MKQEKRLLRHGIVEFDQIQSPNRKNPISSQDTAALAEYENIDLPDKIQELVSRPAVIFHLDDRLPARIETSDPAKSDIGKAGFTDGSILLASLAGHSRAEIAAVSSAVARTQNLPNAPDYSPNKWNANKDSANCYVYAINDFNPKYKGYGTPMDPGQKGGAGRAENFNYLSTKTIEFEKFVKFQIDGAKSDGLHYTGQAMKAAPGSYKVALFARPASGGTSDRDAMDFHWMRQDSNGFWSHKRGSGVVTNKDQQGRLIEKPHLAGMGRYRFIGYFDAPKNGLKLHTKQVENGQRMW
jgi:hypothetical protein